MHEITRTFLQPNKKEITVYKIFVKPTNKYFSIYEFFTDQYPNINNFEFPPIGEWISCYTDVNGLKFPDKLIDPFDEEILYSCGFHSFMNYEQSQLVFKSNLYNNIIVDCVLCECRAKFRLHYGILNYMIDRKKINTEICVSRGIKILKELEV